MGILVAKALTIGSGIVVPSGSLVLAEVTIAIPILYRELQNTAEPASEENEIVQKHRRVIRYILRPFQSIQSWKDTDGTGVIFPKEIPAGWAKEITEEEYAQLVANGAYAEVWLAEYLDELLGGDYCTVVNALV